MKDFFANIPPAIKKETLNTVMASSAGTVIMLLVFLILHLIWPGSVPFDYTVILGGICGAAIAILNFFLMCLTVRKVASAEDKDRAGKIMKLSYTRRYIMQLAWIVIAVLVPCFNLIAGICPLLFPGLGIKIRDTFAFRYVFRDRNAAPAETAPQDPEE